MNSSGIKRGLAGSAITALAITGLPFLATSASAQPGSAFEEGGADAVTLIQPTTENVSAQNDGTDTTVRLSASGGADVTSVSFYYTLNDAAPVLIGTTTRNDNGFFALEWTPTGLAGADVEVFVVSNAATALDIRDLSSRNGKDLRIDNNKNAVEVTDGDDIGVFQAPYDGGAARQQLIFTGTATPGSDPTKFAASWLTGTNSAASDANDAPVDASDVRTPEYDGDALVGTIQQTTSPDAPASAPETFTGILDLEGYPYPGEDDIFVHVVNGAAQTDGGEGYDLYTQTITNVTAEADRTNIPADGDDAKVTVTVTDQNGAPIAGARVVSSDDNDFDNAKFTNAQGQVKFDQGDGTVFYYADATNNDGFQANFGDKRSEDVTVTEFLAEESSLVANSENGDAFALSEVDANDFTVQVTDQNDGDLAVGNRTVNYYWVLTPFDDDSDTERFPAKGTLPAVTDANGEAIVEFPTTASDPEGTYELFAELAEDNLGQGGIDSSKVLTVKAGDAEVEFDGSDPLSGEAGDSIDVSGELVLDDGTGLPGREVVLDYEGDDAGFDQEVGADSDTITLITDEDGRFSATLDDVAATGDNSQDTERGTINATTNAVEDEGGDLDDPNGTGSVDVTFSQADAPADSTVVIGGDIADNDQLGKPGVAVDGTVKVTSPDGDDNDTTRDNVANQIVTLTVDGDSFFTNGPEDDTAGEEAGDLTDRGQEIQVVTDDNGVAEFSVGVEGSEDFNDDGLAEDVVTATINTDTDTEDVDYSSEDPLNGGDVLIEFAADRFQESSVLPLAPTTDDVAYDVKVTDQFGNLVGDENVTITADGGATIVDGDGDSQEPVVEADFDAAPEFFLSSDEETDATPSGTWNANESVYAADDTNQFPDTSDGAADDATVGDADDDADVVTTKDTVTGDGPTTEFYEVDFANSTYTLSQSGAETQPVGSTVIMTYTATDQNGEPIEFDVSFFRSGPGGQGDGNPTGETRETGEDGQVSYVFAGTEEGTATVTAIGYDNGEVVPESQVSDTVTFGEDNGGGGETPPPAIVEAIISADSNGPKKDVVRFQVDDEAEGATVKLFKIRGKKSEGNKRLVQVREDIVPEGGTLTFKVADRNGNKKTRFIAKVSATENSQKAKSNTQKPR